MYVGKTIKYFSTHKDYFYVKIIPVIQYLSIALFRVFNVTVTCDQKYVRVDQRAIVSRCRVRARI